MNRPDEDGGFPWDDVVDIICVGVNPGVLGYERLCAENDLDILVVDWPASPDPQTVEYLAQMTADLDGDVPAEPDPAATCVTPVPPRPAGKGSLEPFVGEQLRRWSALCLDSSSGVLFTQVPDLLAQMRTDTGVLVTAAKVSTDLPPEEATGAFAGMIIEEGRIAGAWVDGPAGRRSVRAGDGLLFAVGRSAGAPPAGPGLALVSRRGGRFARLEPLVVEER